MTGDLAEINEHHALNWLSLGWAVAPGPHRAHHLLLYMNFHWNRAMVIHLHIPACELH